MFRQLAKEVAKRPPVTGSPAPGPMDLFQYHPAQMTALLEAAFACRFEPNASRRGSVLDLPGLVPGPDEDGASPDRAIALPIQIDFLATGTEVRKVSCSVVSDHLIYAYMIENTRAYEIFYRVLYEYLHGERLETPSEETQRWLRITEELFYRDTPSFYAFGVSSYVRPDIRASRRNAYYRMFGLDLNHGAQDGRPYPYMKPAAANRDFVATFERFLWEVWRGIVNATNTSGPTTKDDAAMADLAGRLQRMMGERRKDGNLLREEFFFVATMSWLHLTLQFDESPVVRDLRAKGATPAERLQKIGERVGLPAHGKAHELFALADPMSRLMIALESGSLSSIDTVPVLYHDQTPLSRDIKTIITDWSSATGRNVKGEPVTAPINAMATQPAPPALSSAGFSTNGATPAVASTT
jgi:hypothetical protein